ncbi:unnamed protein product [Phytophthora lilii]|uniref:Unnamed protein product n=1 Tax=Phytophthora lilii TaxID=2077276 RepID=A0A9W6X3H9_9STRA|nr:unnamed protein product [Phytophthora lilii]
MVVLVALVAQGTAALENGIVLGETFGGPHGDKYSDLQLVAPGQNVTAITIRSKERVDGVGIDVIEPSGIKSTYYHGGNGGDPNTLKLGEGEYITGMEAHSNEQHSHTRIFYISFTTNLGRSISGGTPSNDIGKDSAPDGYQLGGFFGYCADELDSVSAIWTSIKPVA